MVLILYFGKVNFYTKDFAYPDHTFDCFGYVMAAYNVSFYSERLRIIDNDFGLNLASYKNRDGFY